MSKIKRYEHEVELSKSEKDNSDLTVVARSHMVECEDGEYISIYDLPMWVKVCLKISNS